MPRSDLLPLLCACLTACCNPPGPDVAQKFLAERDAVQAACAARGAVVELADPVYEYRAPGPECPYGALGCCNTGWCAGLFVPDAPIKLAGGATLLPADVALHEYTHRALLDLGWQRTSGEEHPESFWTVLWASAKIRDAHEQEKAVAGSVLEVR